MLLESARFDRRARAGANPQEYPRIASVGIPTCNRVEGLRRGLVSYIENCRRHGRRNDFVIVDDSPGPETRLQYRQMLQSLSRAHGVEVWYAGLEEKMRFAKRLIDRGGAPPEMVKFALFDLEKYVGSTFGANRNALLLHTVGDMALSVDDDTVCRIGAAPGLQPGVALVPDRRFSASHPCEVWSFPDRETALGAVTCVEQDLLALHETVLGKEVVACVEEHGRGSEGDHNRINVNSFSDLKDWRGRVVATLTGYVGDCAWPSPLSYILMTDSSFERITTSEAVYRSACRSREILRVVTRTSIAEATNFISLSYGFDNRRLLPPFMPVGRGEDTLFGDILSRCFTDRHIAHLPWALFHLPVESRNFWPGELLRSTSGITMTTLISMLVKTLNFESAGEENVAKLDRLGQRLEWLGRLPISDLYDFIHPNIIQEVHSLATHLDERLRNCYGLPECSVNDLRQAINIGRRYVSSQKFLAPLDLMTGRSLDEAMSLAQRLILRFGQLLRVWPEIVRASHELRVEGHRLAQSVSGKLPQ